LRGAAAYRTAAKALQYALQRPVMTIETMAEPDEAGVRALVKERIAALGIADPKQAGRLVGDIMKTHKGQVDAGDVKRVAEELLKG